MDELNKIQFFLFVSLMILSAHALDVILSGAREGFKQKSAINIDIINGEKFYSGTSNPLAYEARNKTTKVIVYIISKSRCIEILRPAVSGTRLQIARELRKMHCELVFLGIENFDDDEYHLIGAFMVENIRRHPNQSEFTIETIGEGRFDQFYRYYALYSFEKYQENAQIWLAWLRSVPHGAFRPTENNEKQIKLYGYQPFVSEVKWPVIVQNNIYVPKVDLTDPKFNFMIKYPNMKICLLILGGNEYSVITARGKRRAQRMALKKTLDNMTKYDEVLIVLGVFNFDWTEIDIVTQIILRHSEGRQRTDYDVFTCGYGMFNTYYQNMYDGDERSIRQHPKSYISEVIDELMGEQPKERVIKIYSYCDDEWKVLNMTINLTNGRYTPEVEFHNLSFTSKSQNQKIVFIVYDIAEMILPIDNAVVIQSVTELKLSGITVILIEPINFRFNDMHIIAEWMDCHSAVINLEQIAVLGAGIFDTIFQSESTTYNTFLNTKKKELETIRNACVRSGNGKNVRTIDLDDYSDFEVRSYPINVIVNGFYEPDLIPDKNMFDTTNETKIYFIITNPNTFQEILTMKDLGYITLSFRHSIRQNYSRWSIRLVALDFFDERYCHLFAEFVKRQTNDRRSLPEFVRIINYDINEALVYQYRDNYPIDVDGYSLVYSRFLNYFRDLCRAPVTDDN